MAETRGLWDTSSQRAVTQNVLKETAQAPDHSHLRQRTLLKYLVLYLQLLSFMFYGELAALCH